MSRSKDMEDGQQVQQMLMHEVYEMSKRREAARYKESQRRLATIKKTRREKVRKARLHMITQKIKTAKTPEMEIYWRAQESNFWEQGGING